MGMTFVLLDMLVAIGLLVCVVICYLKGCNMSRLCLDAFFQCFVFGIITISTTRVDYACHKKITVQSANVIDSDVFPWSCFIPTYYSYIIRPY